MPGVKTSIKLVLVEFLEIDFLDAILLFLEIVLLNPLAELVKKLLTLFKSKKLCLLLSSSSLPQFLQKKRRYCYVEVLFCIYS